MLYLRCFSRLLLNQPKEPLANHLEIHFANLCAIRLWRVSKYVPYYSGENLATVLGDRYEYHPEFAPEFEMLTAFKDKKATWADSEPIYRRLIAGRTPLAGRSPDELDRICLMCTEKTAHQCHRRLAAEYIASQFPDAEIVHL